MNPVLFGVIAGISFGAIDVALMLPLDFPDKTTALLAAFLSRFAIGFLIPLVRMPLSVRGDRRPGRPAGQPAGRRHHQSLCADIGDGPDRRADHRMGFGTLHRPTCALGEREQPQRVVG